MGFSSDPIPFRLVDPDEVASLARYGKPLRWSRPLDVSSRFVEEIRKRLIKRRGEVVLVIPCPSGRVLLHTKAFYPPGAFRLLSGGIEHGERVEAAALREIGEETGLPLTLKRFLGLVEYEVRNQSDQVPFVSYVFLTEMALATPHVQDLREEISQFRDVDWEELPRIAENLASLDGEWRDWGRFRAVPHRLVVEAIRSPDTPAT